MVTQDAENLPQREHFLYSSFLGRRGEMGGAESRVWNLKQANTSISEATSFGLQSQSCQKELFDPSRWLNPW